jgi:gas vesicle protein GvpL/GvpF
MADSATYLYCIVHASETPSAAGVPKGLPGATRPALSPLARSFQVVTATVPLDAYGSEALESSLRNVQWVTDIALAHESVVEHFTRQSGSTVIPMKLFTMFSSEQLALAEMRRRLSEFQAIVRRIAGCEEWGVRITPRVVSGQFLGDSSRAASGTAFLAAKKAARDVARQAAIAAAEAAEEAYRSLAAIAREVRRRSDTPEGATTPPLLDAAFLVPATRRQRFKTAVKRVADSSDGMIVTLTGPWPSYNFIDAGSSA